MLLLYIQCDLTKIYIPNYKYIQQTDNIYNLLDKLPTPPPPPPPLLQSNTTLSEPGAVVFSFAESATLTNGMKPKLRMLFVLMY